MKSVKPSGNPQETLVGTQNSACDQVRLGRAVDTEGQYQQGRATFHGDQCEPAPLEGSVSSPKSVALSG